MTLLESPFHNHGPQAGQPDPIARPLAPWYLQHRDQDWETVAEPRQAQLPG